MTTALVPVAHAASNGSLTHLEDLREQAEGFAESSNAESTRRAYRADELRVSRFSSALGEDVPHFVSYL